MTNKNEKFDATEHGPDGPFGTPGEYSRPAWIDEAIAKLPEPCELCHGKRHSDGKDPHGDEPTAEAGFAPEKLERAFNRVADPSDWKAEINAAIFAEDLELTKTAVEYYTATELHVDVYFENHGRKMMMVSAAGYRMGPAGDH